MGERSAKSREEKRETESSEFVSLMLGEVIDNMPQGQNGAPPPRGGLHLTPEHSCL